MVVTADAEEARDEGCRQRQAFEAYLNNGGGFTGSHVATGDPLYEWDSYVETLIGTRFVEHIVDPQFQAAQVDSIDLRASSHAAWAAGP